MKNLSIMMIACVFITVLACKEGQTEKMVVREVSEVPIAHSSDKSFSNALEALRNSDYTLAGDRLMEATDELKAEANELGGPNKPNLQEDLSSLADYADDLKAGERVDSRNLRELIANAELKISHPYLVDEDVFVISVPDNANDARLTGHINRTKEILKMGAEKLNGEAKKSGEYLEAEGQKLDREYQQWKKKAEDHLSRIDAHFKKYQPEYYYQGFIL